MKWKIHNLYTPKKRQYTHAHTRAHRMRCSKKCANNDWMNEQQHRQHVSFSRSLMIHYAYECSVCSVDVSKRASISYWRSIKVKQIKCSEKKVTQSRRLLIWRFYGVHQLNSKWKVVFEIFHHIKMLYLSLWLCTLYTFSSINMSAGVVCVCTVYFKHIVCVGWMFVCFCIVRFHVFVCIGKESKVNSSETK